MRAGVLATALALNVAAAAAQQMPTFRSGVDLTTIVASVTDKRGNPVTDLERSDFEIYEDGERQAIAQFAVGLGEGDAPPLHLGLLLDVSDSMGDDIAFTKTAAIKFLNLLTDAEDITVVDFDTEVRAARYSQAEFARAIERIRQKSVSGNTAVYDAVGLYLDGAASQDGRKIMLLYTDGGDTRSVLPLHELMDLLKASDVTLYVVGALEHQPASVRTQQRMVLMQMADATGGLAFFPSSVKGLDEVYDKVLEDIRAQYTIGYAPTRRHADGSWRKVDVRVVRKDDRGLRVRARKGYFAPYVPR